MRHLSSWILIAAFAGCGFDSGASLDGIGDTPGLPGDASSPDAGTPDQPLDCSNGDIDDGEQCDDGNQSSGDGCSQSCTIEPAFVCDEPGESCERVVSLRIEEELEPMGLSVTFSDELESVTCEDGVLIGFAGRTIANTDAFSGVRGLCADLEIQADGTLSWFSTGNTDLIGENGPVLGQTSCAEGELMVGLQFQEDGVFVKGVAPICAPAIVENGELTVGATSVRELLGFAPPSPVAMPVTRNCGQGRGVSATLAVSPSDFGFFAFGVLCGRIDLDVD